MKQYVILKFAWKGWAASIGFIIATLALWGCTTSRPEAITTFGAGVTSAQHQTEVAFQGINDLCRDASVEYALTQPTLSEKSFVTAIPPETSVQWFNTFSQLEMYVSNLQKLLSPKHAQEFENSVSDFVTQLQNTHAGSVEVPPGVAAGFAELGRVLIQVKAQHDARAIMLQTDPAIQAIFTTMASAIGDNQRSSLRGTVFSNWTTLMTGPQRNFVTVGSDTERKRQAILGYREMLDRRDSQDAALASLRHSLLLLADAHTAAAQGSQTDVAALLAMVSTELQGTKALFEKFSQPKEAK